MLKGHHVVGKKTGLESNFQVLGGDLELSEKNSLNPSFMNVGVYFCVCVKLDNTCAGSPVLFPSVPYFPLC